MERLMMILGYFGRSLHSLTDWRKRFPRIRPHGLFWEVPAGIESMLRYAGIDAISQEDLVLGYCRKHGDEALSEIVSHVPLRVVPASIQGMGEDEIIELARQSVLRRGSFDTLAEPARRKLAFRRPPLSLDIIAGLKSQADYFAAMMDAVKADCPILISLKGRDEHFHPQVVLEVDPDRFIAYDPARNIIARRQVAKCDFPGEALVLRPAA
jgi:hypothetical protein